MERDMWVLRWRLLHHLLFAKPPKAHETNYGDFTKTLIDRLKLSFAIALVHFFPLSGRLKTIKNYNPILYSFYVDCNHSLGAKFIFGAIDMSMSGILSLIDGTSDFVNQSFSYGDKTFSDFHTMSLLSVKVTELVDGVFIGCDITHSIADGNSFWHFFNMWSEIFQVQGNNKVSISCLSELKRSLPKNLPSVPRVDDLIDQILASTPSSKLRRFYFSAKAITKLKGKANEECSTGKISSFQTLSALIWRSTTQARHLPPNETTTCMLLIDARSKQDPPLSQDYFGNMVDLITEVTTANELLENGYSWSAWKLHKVVANYTVEAKGPAPTDHVYTNCVLINGSFRFNIFGNGFV